VCPSSVMCVRVVVFLKQRSFFIGLLVDFLAFWRGLCHVCPSSIFMRLSDLYHVCPSSFLFMRLSDLYHVCPSSFRADKRGAIPVDLPPILDRLDIEPKHWLYITTRFESKFKSLVGGWYSVRKAYRALGYQRSPGLRECRQLF